ncbi:MAG: sulfurtransferase-like selenium metabolism protein YedF [Coriobacteriaceae bacterium]|nr:sulfurtransferase-like selenium metabolism protein YedF [Coriobacteriaceae bacterium]
MELVIDAMGDKCPVPVVKAKKALGTMDTGTVEVHVDNETSVTNLKSLAKSLGCEVSDKTVAEGAEYHVFITKTEASASAEEVASSTEKKRVVVISSQVMGSGDDTLGASLMKAFIFSLTQQDALPDTVLFYNGGAHLTCEGSPCLEDLEALEKADVEILTCGTCLKHYGLDDKIAIGGVTNMYVIAEKQLKADVVVRP